MDSQPDKKLKIGYLMQADSVDMDKVSGPRLHVEAVFKGFIKRGHQVRMVTIRNNKIQWTDDLKSWYPGEYGFSESKVFRLIESFIRGFQSRLHLPYFRIFDSYKYSDACISALSGYDILYQRDGTMSYGGVIAAHRLGIPFILEVNGDLIEEWEQIGLRFTKSQRKVVHFITRQTYHRATHIIAVGETIRKRLISRWGLDPSHVSVVTNGADVDLFLDIDGASDVRDRYMIGNRPMVIFVGGFQPWHGVDLILEGFRYALFRVPEARMIFVGDGPKRSEMQKQAESYGLCEQVVFTGRTDHTDVARLLNAAQVAVIYHRGNAAEIVETPLKLFEYMAAGKAIVAPAVPNMERILTDRVNALLVPPDNPEALATAFIELFEDEKLRADLGSEARKEAIEQHSWDRAIRELDTIFYNLLESSKNEIYAGNYVSE